MTDLEKPKKTSKKKPPTIMVGVSGFEAFEAKEIPSEQLLKPTDWRYLSQLPPFQMFADEEVRLTSQQDIDQWVQGRREALGDNVFYNKYAEWHKAKGYWLNETPRGELIECL